MSRLLRSSLTLGVALLGLAAAVSGGEPLHERIDGLIAARSGGRAAAGPRTTPSSSAASTSTWPAGSRRPRRPARSWRHVAGQAGAS